MSKTISFRTSDMPEDEPVSVTYDFGENLEEAVERFGEDVVFSRFVAAATIDIQALGRRHLSGENPKSQAAIQAIVDEWKPGVSNRSRKSAKEKAQDILAKLSDEERAQLLAEL